MEKKKVLYDMVIAARDYIKNLIDHNPDSRTEPFLTTLITKIVERI